jgi:hypothetical protein
VTGRFGPLEPAGGKPGVLTGRPVPVPDPEATVEGMRDRPFPNPSQDRYGAATSDPLGRTILAPGKRYGIPRYPCPDETCAPWRRVLGHKGDHGAPKS